MLLIIIVSLSVSLSVCLSLHVNMSAVLSVSMSVCLRESRRSYGNEHHRLRLLPKQAAALHANRAPYKQHRRCVSVQVLHYAEEPVCGIEACSYSCGATSEASGKTD